ncbi:TlpA family protein disulfide reductase [Campylobacter sp. faydin G-24]|uniref:TlpA family protein disulfide reductase n=1 Tax=Campylobacter anatolicus TaxID=2829105 RepID=A0ABS5HGF0_9BACT|nr:TlpA disulfide reductase family protein [Campylobacter anatolicus]MBR8461605.1 TlpA family protein disulfide reductase [Campylobacter anatolicus]MBR8463343.1 TlpA family protein disulfide reductase [Campylobacter anatolicus]
MCVNFKAIFSLLFMILVLFGCGNDGYNKNHIVLNSPNGVKTQYFPEDRRLMMNDGKAYMLFFFGTSCGVCMAQAPIINEIYSEFRDKFSIYGIFGPSLGFDKDLAIIKEHNINYNVISDKISVDYFSKVVGGVMGVPAIFIFDSHGNLKRRFIGLTPKPTLENEIKLIL